jgi:hypothetical protein
MAIRLPVLLGSSTSNLLSTDMTAKRRASPSSSLRGWDRG